MAEEEVLLTKKGTVRKRKPKKANVYFTQDTEDAIPLCIIKCLCCMLKATMNMLLHTM